jgi:RimJ/RimL family protein N-acetyltransferase
MLHGDQVILRPMERVDIPRLWEFCQDLEISLIMGGGGRPTPLAAAEQIYEDNWANPPADAVRFGIEAHGGVLIGGAELSHIDWQNRSCEVAVWIGDHTYRRIGCGGDALQVAVTYAFKVLGMHRLSMRIAASNEAAKACYASVGFQEEGLAREARYLDGEYGDVALYGLLRTDWANDTPLQTGDSLTRRS